MKKFIEDHSTVFIGLVTVILTLVVAGFTTHVSRPHDGVITIERYERDRDEDTDRRQVERIERNDQIQRIEDKVDAILLRLPKE